MSMNVGTFDRLARLIIGILAIAYAIPIGFPSTGWNWVGWIGLIPLATAAFGMCPLYSVLGITTSTAKTTKA
jgi:hypothetical protein